VTGCGTQAELDGFWERLSEGGEQGQCGWLKDKFGLSWQIVPLALGEMMQDQDPGKTNRLWQRSYKLEIDGLRRAYDGVAS
jgi:predicted 3-demethylubiquinone-9 3-methyltransferase (glyoxalase superfamily)